MLTVLTFLIFAMWSISIILLFMKSEEKANLWFSALFFLMGLGKVNAIIGSFIVPNSLLYRFIESVCLRFFPYVVLMSGISYSDFFSIKWKKQFKYLLFIPIIITYILDLIVIKEGFVYKDLPNSGIYWVTYIWTVPYFLFSNCLFYYAYNTETVKQKKQKKLLVFIMLSLPTLIVMINNLTTASENDWWKYLLIHNFTVVGLFLYFIGKYGFKLKLKKEYEHGASSTATLITHTVKNELNKIKFEVKAAEKGLRTSQESFNNILYILDHTDQIIDRVRDHMQDFILKRQIYYLGEIIDGSLASFEPILAKKEISVTKEYLDNPEIFCDKAHITEVLNNILTNAIEAIDEAGDQANRKIKIEVSTIQKEVIIKISNNGVNIPSDKLDKVTMLFYSTKAKGSEIRGSGLFYCVSVIEKHFGKFNIKNEPGQQGIAVEITLPLIPKV